VWALANHKGFPRSAYTAPVAIFSAYLVFATIRGVANEGFNLYYIASDLKAWCMYPLVLAGRVILARCHESALVTLRRFVRNIVIISGCGAALQIVASIISPNLMLVPAELPRVALGLPVRVISLTDRVYTLTLLCAVIMALTEDLKMWRLVGLGTASVILGKVVISASRTVVVDVAGTLAVLGAVALVTPSVRSTFGRVAKRRAALVGILVMSTGFLVLPLVFDMKFFGLRVSQPFGKQLESARRQRGVLYEPVLKLFHDSPFFGGGIGTRFFYVFQGIQPGSRYSTANNAYVDGLYVTILGKLGLCGLTLFCWIYVITFRNWMFLARRLSKDMPLSIACFVAVFGAFVTIKLASGTFSAELGYFRVIAVYLIGMGILESLAQEMAAGPRRVRVEARARGSRAVYEHD
jgi:hypothetical protein